MKEKLAKILRNFVHRPSADRELKELLALAAKEPEDMRVKIKIGELYVRKKKLAQGVQSFREVAEYYTGAGFLLKAIALYKAILKFSPGSVEFNEKLGELYHRLHMNADALQQYQIVIHYYLTHGRAAEAIRVCQKLVAEDPGEIKHQLRLAEIYLGQGMEEDAMREYERIARGLRREMKDLENLVRVYEIILLKRTKEWGLLRELCVFYLKLRRPEKAIHRIEKYKLQKQEQFQPIYEKALQMRERLASARPNEVRQERAVP